MKDPAIGVALKAAASSGGEDMLHTSGTVWYIPGTHPCEARRPFRPEDIFDWIHPITRTIIDALGR
ncbi:MAG: hypothetical protein HC808_12110 [Candidatus Competibacteraceae bacterium]|nr:hypothetical protein [Candidatus Competibacteraceae bacterium]